MMSQIDIAYKWKHISDLPSDLLDKKNYDLIHIAEIWGDYKKKLLNADAFKHFNDRLRREWAIETGIIEGLYSLDRGITQLLIEKGIEDSLIPFGTTDRPVSEIIPILKDQESTLEGLFDFVSSKRKLTTFYIKELHQNLTRNQSTTNAIDSLGQSVKVSLIKGAWKTQSNNPLRKDGKIHEYCPPEHVASEMDALIEKYDVLDQLGVSPNIIAAWLHHRFTQIHPFQDGNGRVARALASLVFIKAGWFPLVISRDLREEYIKSLEVADIDQDLNPLIDLMSRIQQKAFIKALSISEETLRQTEPIEDVISRASEKIRQRKFEEYQGMLENAISLAEYLEDIAENRLNEIKIRLDQLKDADSDFYCKVTHSDSENDFWFRHEIVEVARKEEYYADTRIHRGWVRLRIVEDREINIILSFHGLGIKFLGLMTVSAFLLYKDKTEEKTSISSSPLPIFRDLFQFSYKDNKDDLKRKFDKWINEVILFGLNEWQKQL